MTYNKFLSDGPCATVDETSSFRISRLNQNKKQSWRNVESFFHMEHVFGTVQKDDDEQL